MTLYAVDKLMAETRRLAAEYYKTTEQTLPVTAELARFDAAKLLGLDIPEMPVSGVDAVGQQGFLSNKSVQIKGRVIFNEERRGGYRIGQLNLDGNWDAVVLVLYNKAYDATELYAADNAEIKNALSSGASESKSARGALSVARFKAIAELLWTSDAGLQKSKQ